MFDNMVAELLEPQTLRIKSDAFKDNGFVPISEQEFELFLKESIFETLKGNKLGVLFQKKFGVRDRVLSMFSDDKDVIQHIRYCKYVDETKIH